MTPRRDTIEFYRDVDGRWRWHYRASNGRILADSGQAYVRRIDAVHAAERISGYMVDLERGASYPAGWPNLSVHRVVVTA